MINLLVEVRIDNSNLSATMERLDISAIHSGDYQCSIWDGKLPPL
jgi:hypothetical protein